MTVTDQSQTQKTVLYHIFIYLIGIALFAYNFFNNQFFLHDDAFISLRYAQNFADVGDLSWNLGDRVEGYTNFLYVLISSALLKIGIDPVVTVRLINAIATVLLVGAAYDGARALFPDRKEAHALSVVLILGNISVSVWLLGGLEAPLAAAFIAWGIAFLLRAIVETGNGTEVRYLALSGVAFALAVLTRPDGVILVAATFFAYCLTASGTWKAKFVKAAVVAGIPFLVFMAHMVWRISYYEDLVPNTFHAKVGLALLHRLENVSGYFLRSAVLYLPVMSCAFAAFVAAIVWGKVSRTSIMLILICSAFLLYVIWSGGDHMPAARVFLTMAGPLTLLAISLWGSLSVRMTHGLSVGFLAILAFASLNGRSFQMDWAAFNGTIVGRYIEDAWPDESLVALNTAGSTPFHGASHRYIDMLGLNDRTIAQREDVPILARRQAMPGHGKGDGAYVISRKPDYMILGGSEGIAVEDAEKWFLTGVEIREIPYFVDCYEKMTVRLEIPEDMKKFRTTAKPFDFTYYQNKCS